MAGVKRATDKGVGSPEAQAGKGNKKVKLEPTREAGKPHNKRELEGMSVPERHGIDAAFAPKITGNTLRYGKLTIDVGKLREKLGEEACLPVHLCKHPWHLCHSRCPTPNKAGHGTEGEAHQENRGFREPYLAGKEDFY